MQRGDRGDLLLKRVRSYGKDLVFRSRELRRNMTDAERKLWQGVRGKQIKGLPFYRQKPIGVYIVDFYCPRAGLVIEVDGGQHFEQEGEKRDRQRDAYLKSLGLMILKK